MAPSVLSQPGVNSSSAPSAWSTAWRSVLTQVGMVSLILKPMAAATIAMPIPVLPDVGSRMILPLVSFPVSTASLSMKSAGRSLTEPPGLEPSSFAMIRTPVLPESQMFFTSTSGVFPIASSTLIYELLYVFKFLCSLQCYSFTFFGDCFPAGNSLASSDRQQ